MDYFPRKSLSKYLITDTIDFNKHVHDIDIFINDKWRKYAVGDIGRLFKITRRLELCFWPMRKRSQPSQGDFFARIALQREPCSDTIFWFWSNQSLLLIVKANWRSSKYQFYSLWFYVTGAWTNANNNTTDQVWKLVKNEY
jgi:hypothetical protein